MMYRVLYFIITLYTPNLSETFQQDYNVEMFSSIFPAIKKWDRQLVDFTINRKIMILYSASIALQKTLEILNKVLFVYCYPTPNLV